MILAPAVLAALLVAWALGGDLRRLVDLRFAGTSLIYGAFGLQLVVFTPLFAPYPAALRLGQLLSYVLLAAFAWRNRRLGGMTLIGAGIAANALAIAANGGFMPVDGAAAVASGWSLDVWAQGPYNNTQLMDASTHLAFLGDVFAVPHLPLAAALSVGDLLLLVGACVLFARQTSPVAAPRRRLLHAPLRSGPFRTLMLVQTTSALASWLTAAALVGWIYASDDGLWGSSAILLARGGAGALSSVLGGRLSDRVGRGRMLAGGELVQAACLVAIVLLAGGGPTLPIYVLYVVSSLAAAATGPALRAAVPQVVPSDEALNAANGVLGTARAAAMAAGALCGGLLTAAFGPQHVLLVAAVALAASGLGYAALRLRDNGPVTEEPSPEPPPAGAAFRLRDHRAVWPILGMFGVATLGTGLLNAALPAILDRAGAGSTAYGVGLGTIGVGLLVGQLTSGAFRPGLIRPRTIAVALLLMAFASALVGATALLATTLLALFAVGLFDGMTETIFDTLVQRTVPAHAHGAVFGLADGLFTSTMLAGLAAAPLLSHRLAGSHLSLIAGGCLLAAGVAGLLLDAAAARRGARAAALATPLP